MVSLDNSRIASLEVDSKTFEIFVDPNIALDIKEGRKKIDNELSNLLAVEEIYKDAGKGEKASPNILFEVFKSNDLKEIVLQILQKGRLDLTTEQKRKILLDKKKEVVYYIVRNSINPVTNTPHTHTRVEGLIEDKRIEIDLHKSVNSQMDKIIEKLRPHLPMIFQTNTYSVSVPSSLGSKVLGAVSKYEILERKWNSDSFVFIAKVPVGVKDSFLNTVSQLTKNVAKIELM